MEQINLIHKPKRKPNGITKADREARKSDDLLKRDFTADWNCQEMCSRGIPKITDRQESGGVMRELL